MTKTERQLIDLQRAFRRLKFALAQPPTKLNRDATIQRFEFTFELAWKLMLSLLNPKKILTKGPRGIIREAARVNLVNNPLAWFKFLEFRNLTTHTYKEELAIEVYQKIPKFIYLIDELIQTAKDF